MTELNKIETQKKFSDQLLTYYYVAISYWWIFLIFFIVIVFLYYFLKRYEYDYYSVNTSVLVNTQNYNPEFIAGGLVLESRSNLDNEIAKIKSYNLVYKAILNANIRVLYYEARKFGYEPELYKNTPFIVVIIDSSKNFIGTKNYVYIIDSFRYEIRFGKNKEKKILTFNQVYEDDLFSFKIIRNHGVFNKNVFGKTYYFTFLEPSSYAKYIQQILNVQLYSTQSTLLWIWIVDKNVERNIDLINAIVDVYIEENIKRKNYTARKTIEFIDYQIGQFSDSLRISEMQLQKFKLSVPTIDLKKDGNKIYEELLKLEGDKKKLLLQKKYYTFLKEELDKEGDISFFYPSLLGIEDVFLEKILSEYSSKKLNYDIFKSNVDSQLNIAANKQKIVELSKLKGLIAKYLNDAIDVLNNKLSDIDRNIKKIESDISALPEKEREYIQINRKFELNNQIYTFLLQRRMEASITLASNEPDVYVVDRASWGTVQYKGRRGGMSFTKLMVIGILFSIGLIVLLELAKVRIDNLSEVEFFANIPILSAVPFNYRDNNLPVVKHPNSSISEAFRRLRTNILYYFQKPKGNVIILTSMISGEGKSFISANLAASFANLNKKTLLICFDLRKPKIEEFFPFLAKKPGFTHFYLDQKTLKEIIFRYEEKNFDNLFLMSNGDIPPFPAEMIESEKTKELITKLKEEFDVIVIDTPPVGIVADALSLLDLADIFLYVVREAYTFKNSIKIINQIVLDRNIKKAGIIYNGLKKYISYAQRYGYSYNYYYGKYKHNYYEIDESKDNLIQKIFNFLKKIRLKKKSLPYDFKNNNRRSI